MMSVSSLKKRITEDMKTAMRNKEKVKLGTLRLILAALKQEEVDSRKVLDDTTVLVILDKMCKQRRDSIEQFSQAGRDDLASQEQKELKLIQGYLPTPLTAEELAELIDEAVATTSASSMRDMGKLMAYLKPKLQGRADMGSVSRQVKQRLVG